MFIQDLPRTETVTRSNFCESLKTKLAVLGFEKSIITLNELLKFDWSRVKVDLVYSVPGMETINTAKGLAMLSQYVPISREGLSIEVQGSSLGSLEQSWLTDFTSCCHGRLEKDPDQDAQLTSLKIIFPTMDYVRNSPEGPGAFGTIFCQQKNWAKYPKSLMFQCQSQHGHGQPLHSKIIAAHSRNTDAPVWYYLGTANFTPSAWGKLVKGGSALMTANYELGVIVRAEHLPSICPKGFPFPYQRPPKPYSSDDTPWFQDQVLF